MTADDTYGWVWLETGHQIRQAMLGKGGAPQEVWSQVFDPVWNQVNRPVSSQVDEQMEQQLREEEEEA